MQLGSMFISNCNNALHVSDAFFCPSSGALKNCISSLWCVTWDGVKYPIRASKVDGFRTIWLSAEVIDPGRPYWILHHVSCHTPETATTLPKCCWGWTQKVSETCRVLLQLLINILPSCITLVLYIRGLYRKSWATFFCKRTGNSRRRRVWW